MSAPLEGIKVLDFSTLLPGPLATLVLAEAGARVTKVERPGRGDEMRSYEPKFGPDSANFALLNRGKESLALDLKSEGATEVLRPRIEETDVLVEQFRPGVMERLGLGYEAVREMNPRIVYCSVSGYGQNGPRARRAAHDLNYVSETGLIGLTSTADESPALPQALVADVAGGSYPAVMNVLLALMRRERTGEGAHLDISMADNVFTFLYWAMGSGAATGEWPRAGGELLTGGSPRYHLYRASDGRYIAAAPLEERFWSAFCDLINLEEELRDDSVDPEATISGVARRISLYPSDHWSRLFDEVDVCCNVVRSVEEAMKDEHFGARGLFDRAVEDGEGRTIPALPLPLARGFQRPEVTLGYPRLGEDG